MKFTIFIILLFISTTICSQEFYKDLNGFRLGQYREVAKNEFKTLLQQGKYDDGNEYECFLIEPDTSVYTAFEYGKNELQIIGTIQITGTKVGYDCRFRELKLGMPALEVEKLIGKASSKKDIENYGEIWYYDKSNFSVEINPVGRLSSIKIIDNSYDLFPESNFDKLPNINDIKTIFQSGNRNMISEIIAPAVEIYYKNKTHYLKNSFSNEIKNDKSEIFHMIGYMSEVLKQINTADTLQYEQNIRLIEHQDPLHVAKIHYNDKYYEIVYKYQFGKYLIWEINLEKDLNSEL